MVAVAKSLNASLNAFQFAARRRPSGQGEVVDSSPFVVLEHQFTSDTMLHMFIVLIQTHLQFIRMRIQLHSTIYYIPNN